ncbi:MAG: LytTR family transcriptional regulator [Eudoraea sp.]|nr:LytTR family transcriptional regulator [Eudoraea sp.]
MNFYQSIRQLLARPFPEVENGYIYIRDLLIFSVFITFFLYIFQPFGIATLESDKFLICLGFGGMTFLGTLVYELMVRTLLGLNRKPVKWTFGKWILNMLGIIFSISLANFLFIRLLIFGFIEWNLFPSMIYGTFMVGIIPVVVYGFWFLNRNESKYQSISDEINQNYRSPAEQRPGNTPSIFDIPMHQIRYIEAMQNYSRIGFINARGELDIRTERITLKQILEEMSETSIVKCHRSFLVNKEAIIATSGNAQGLLLQLADCDKEVPVSRSLVHVFR